MEVNADERFKRFQDLFGANIEQGHVEAWKRTFNAERRKDMVSDLKELRTLRKDSQSTTLRQFCDDNIKRLIERLVGR